MAEVPTTRFLHASDIHLGAKQYQNPVLADDHLYALQQILDLAISKHVDFVLLGGDVFTSQDILSNQMEQILDTLTDFQEKTAAKIPLIAIEGNHDIRRYSHGNRIPRHQSWLRILNKLGLICLLDASLDERPQDRFALYNSMTRRGGKMVINNCTIYGTSYLGKQLKNNIQRLREGIDNEDGQFHILLQHFGIQGQMKGVPGQALHVVSCLRDNVDYLGLGHYHLGFSIQGWIYNPGCAQAISAMENSFQRGVLYGEISGTDGSFRKKISLMKLKNRPIQWLTVFFSQKHTNIREIYAQIERSRINQGLFPISEQRKFIGDGETNLPETKDYESPLLHVVFKGNQPSNLKAFEDKPLRAWFRTHFPVVDVKIYRKFTKYARTLETYTRQPRVTKTRSYI